MFLVSTLLISCNENNDINSSKDSEIGYRELSASEIILKDQLAIAAKIVVEISEDTAVLNEIVASIKSQPSTMEDRVKFDYLMKQNVNEKSSAFGVEKNKFATAFKNKLPISNLKSASVLIEDLTAQGIEVYIPYPIEDYPKNVDIVVTSNPLDNLYENDGYIIGKPEKIVKANDELAKTNPIIIITTPLYRDEFLSQISSNISEMNKIMDNNNDLKLKSINSEPTDWFNESIHYGIFIPKIYCTDDHVYGLFSAPGYMYVTRGTVTFDLGTKIVLSNMDVGTFGFSLPRKYENYAKQGWDKGWFSCNLFLWEDWQPAITQNSLTICIDVPNESTTISNGITASWLQKTTAEGSELSKNFGYSASCSTTVTTRDFVYGSIPFTRERYLYNYPLNRGAVWGEDGQTCWKVEGIGDRPAIPFSTELKYLTYCDVW